MSITRVGATKQYSDNWDKIFGGGTRRSASKKTAAKPARKSPKKIAKGAKADGKKRAGGAKRKAR
ncbi:MAG: RNA polymerase subunit sigma [Planctomycetes bacterium]|nr:RNA polymerase subunit sigma [Planctomycetota bacterium]